MEQRGVGEDAVEVAVGQVELQKILLPHVTTGRLASHCHERRRAFQSDCAVPEPRERRQVSPGPAPEVEDRERCWSDDMLQQRGNVLTYVVVARALPKILRTFTVVRERALGELLQFLRRERLGRLGHLASDKAGELSIATS